MSKTQPSRINNPEIVSKGIELATLDPISGKALWKTLKSKEKKQLFDENFAVQRMTASDPKRQQQRPGQKEKTNINTIKSMTPVKRAIESHNDPKYDNLYSHQQTFQDELIKNYASNSKAVAKMEEILPDIDKIKLSVMSLRSEEQQLNIKDRSIIYGHQKWNDAEEWVDDAEEWVDEVSYGRNEEWHNWWNEAEMNDFRKNIDNIFYVLSASGVSESDAARLIILRLWLGKYGYQDPDGMFYGVGEFGNFVYSRIKQFSGKYYHIICYFYFDDLIAWRRSTSEKPGTRIKTAHNIIRS